MSLGNVIVSIVTPIVLIICAIKGISPWAYFFFGTIGCALILINHTDNIQRILSGTERKIGEKATPSAPSA
jgi:glycerol-3-phosphate acyltransferase PlsY